MTYSITATVSHPAWLASPSHSPAASSWPGPISTGSFGGSLGGVIDARDGALKTAESALDALAFDLATQMNAVHSTGWALDGSTGHDLFTIGAAAPGTALAIQVDASLAADPNLLSAAATAATVPGDATNAFALVALETLALSSGKSAEGTLALIVTTFGSASQRATAMAGQEAALRDNLLAMRESTSGVSIDEEMVEMTRAQRAYEAVTKVIAAADSMLETLMKLR